MTRAAALWLLALVVGALVACSPHEQREAAASPAPATTAAEPDETPATPYTSASAVATSAPSASVAAPVAVDLPDEFPRPFPLPPGGVVTQATAERDEGSVQASAVVLSRDGVQPLFAWYETALGGAGWNIEHEESKGNGRSLHAVKGDSTADVVVTPDDEHAGWTAAALDIYWSQGKGR